MDLPLTDILLYLFLGGIFFMMIRGGGCCGGHKKKKVEAGDSKEIVKR